MRTKEEIEAERARLQALLDDQKSRRRADIIAIMNRADMLSWVLGEDTSW